MHIPCTLEPGATIPTRAKVGDAGYDLYPLKDYTIYPGQRLIILTGIRLAIPQGYYGRIAERSGYGSKGLAVGAGVIDSNYRGPIGVVVRNLRFFDDIAEDEDPQLFFKFEEDRIAAPIEISRKKAIAQIIFERHFDFEIIEGPSLEASNRGESGFGSTDKVPNPNFDSSDTDSEEFQRTGYNREGRKLHTGERLPDGSTYIEPGDTSFAAG